MDCSKANDCDSDLSAVFISGSMLPQRIFKKAFSRYLFFDVDVCSSGEFVSTLHQLAKECLGVRFKVDVFASSNRVALGSLDVNSNWVLQIKEICMALRVAGDYYGLIMIDASKRWVFYQRSPVDIGILAFDGISSFSSLDSAVGDFFFACSDIASWLAGNTARDVELTNSVGRKFLTDLLSNYGNAEVVS